MSLHCIQCNCLWGSGKFTGSSGLCPSCFTEWINEKRRIKGLQECYGTYDKYEDTDCCSCSLSLICFKDTYGIE